MKIAKVLNPITLNATLLWGFPVRHLPALLRYLLKNYDHSFLKVLIISQLILNISQSFCFSVMPFPDVRNIIPKSVTFLSIWYLTWSYPVPIDFCIHVLLIKIKDPILPKFFNSLLISSYFSTLYKLPLLQLSTKFFNPFLITLDLSFNSLNLGFFFNPSPPQFFLNLACLYPPQSYVSILAHFSSYAPFSSILSILSPRHLLP